MSPEDTNDLVAWLGKEDLDSDAKELIAAQLKQFVDLEKISPQVIMALEAKLPAILGPSSKNARNVPNQVDAVQPPLEQKNDYNRPAHRFQFLKTAWFKYAAAILITLGSVAYLWINTRDGKALATTNGKNRSQTDVSPGGDKAILTLADGSKIVLDSAANGDLAQQGNAQVVKLSNGQIVYNLKGSSDKVVWNTMTTPAGGQYQVTLPDGTRVWLNAASSITYPTAFVGKQRSVKISGEVYFEAAKDKEKAFIVDIDGKSSVQVLGTSFNINSYENEGNVKTTLFEGSVKVISGTMKSVVQPLPRRLADKFGQQPKPSGTDGSFPFVILKPGQQAQTSGPEAKQSISVVNNPNMEQILAWKNGLFNFSGADLYAVMRQLERWYDIKVKYQGSVPQIIFKGEMDRNVNLSDVLEFFTETGLKFRMEGGTLVVL